MTKYSDLYELSELHLHKMVLLKGYKMVKGIINNEPLLYRIQWLYKWRKPPKIFCYGIWHFSCHMCQFSLKLAPRLMMVSCDCQKHSEGCAERARWRRGRGGGTSFPQTSALMSSCISHSTIKSELASVRGEKIWARGETGAGESYFTHPPFQCLDPSAFVFIQLRCEVEEKLRGKHCFGIRSMTFVIVCSPTLSLQLVIICMRWQNQWLFMSFRETVLLW